VSVGIISLDQNLIIIYHKFNDNFKSYDNFERTREGLEVTSNITLKKKRKKKERERER